MQTVKNILVADRYGRPMATDIFYDEASGRRPVIIYAHGFNGFKDWGAFDLIAQQIAAAGFTFIKFNFSYNGTTPAAPEEFTDLEGYAENNYTKELDNLGTILDWACAADNKWAAYIDTERIGIIGHSMGGGITILKAAEDIRVKAIATWASIGVCKTPWTTWPEAQLAEWKATGVQYIKNSRTGQDMPLNYQLYEDYQQNQERLDIRGAIKRLQIPVLICHGSKDTSVPVKTAYELLESKEDAELFIVESDHVFGRKHPWEEATLPQPMQVVMDKTIEFFVRSLPGA